MTKKILVDSTPLIRKKFDGVSRYSVTLLENFKQLYGDEYDLKTVGFIDDKAKLSHKLWLPRKVYSGLHKLFSLSLPSRFNLGFYPNFTLFPLQAKKSVVVVHDLAYLDRPDEVSAKNRLFLSKFVPRSVKQAFAVVAVSDFTRQRLNETYGTPLEKISVITPGVDVELYRQRSLDLAKLRSKYSLPEKYILCFGSLEPRKNLVNTLDAYGKLDAVIKQQFPLVLAGGSGWLNSDIKNKIAAMRQAGSEIILTGYIEDADVPAIYIAASLLLFASAYEGFGIPILEAQAAGTPVITSNLPPMSSVAGDDGAVLVDPNDSQEIAGAIQNVLNNDELRLQIIENGLANSQQYTWQASAEALKAVFDKL